MTLARERAIATAYLVAGDDDLREGVADAQEMGVRVVLIGIEPAMTLRNQADPLIREADRHVVLGRDFWSPFFTDRSVPAATVEGPIQELTTSVEERVPVPAPEDLGRAFGMAWVKRATADEVRSLLASSPQVPYYVDRELLVSAQSAIGPLWERPDARAKMRDGFWAGIREAAPTPES
jgi:NYN domain